MIQNAENISEVFSMISDTFCNMSTNLKAKSERNFKDFEFFKSQIWAFISKISWNFFPFSLGEIRTFGTFPEYCLIYIVLLTERVQLEHFSLLAQLILLVLLTAKLTNKIT